MILFSTQSAKHIAQSLKLPIGASTIKKFSDGELLVKINQDVTGKSVWLVASTPAPADTILELFFMLDQLQHLGAAQINVVISYFSYARQLESDHGQAAAGQTICRLLKNFAISKLFIIQPHNKKILANFLPYIDISDKNFFCSKALLYDAIAAPDQGAHEFAKEIAAACNKDLILLSKKRTAQEAVEIVSLAGTVKNKKILIVDDIISTGNTIMSAAQELKKHGADLISAAAMHAVFASGTQERLQQSILNKIYVTNTIAQDVHGKIEVTDIGPLILEIIEQNS